MEMFFNWSTTINIRNIDILEFESSILMFYVNVKARPCLSLLLIPSYTNLHVQIKISTGYVCFNVKILFVNFIPCVNSNQGD